MFEGYLSSLLASTLGHFINIDKEKLRVSLFSAWRTGLSLKNVELRTEAFEYLQLPFRLVHGTVGSVQAQVPWQALRSPVVIDLADVHLQVCLRDEHDLHEGPAGERAWAAKQAELAAAELQALAGGGGGAAAPAAGAQEGRGILWSFVQHLINLLVNRLQLTVRNVHVAFQDPETGTSFGLKLAMLHTCLPGEASHASLLLSEDAGVLAHSSAAARGSIQKQLAVQGLAVYWQPGHGGGDVSSHGARAAQPLLFLKPPQQQQQQKQQQQQEEGEQQHASWQEGKEGGRVAEAQQPPEQEQLPEGQQQRSQPPGGEQVQQPVAASEEQGQQGLPPAPDEEQLPHILLPTDFVVHITSQLGPGAAGDAGDAAPGVRIHAAAVVHSLELSLSKEQAFDLFLFADRLQWLAARNRYAAYRPAGWLERAADGGWQQPRVPWRRMWQYAINAVLADKRGARRCGLRWRAPEELSVLRQAYAALCGRKLRSARLLAGAGSRLTEQEQAELEQLERNLSVQDILRYRSVAKRELEVSVPDKGAPPAPPAQPGALVAPGARPGAAPPPEGGAWATRNGGNGSGHVQQGYVMWGLSKAAAFLGYVPRAEGAAGELPAPTENDMRELYSAVNFHPEAAAAAATPPKALPPTAAPTAAAAAAAQRGGLQLSLDLLVTQTGLVLRGGAGANTAGAGAPGGASSAPAAPPPGPFAPYGSCPSDVAVAELGRLRFSLQVAPGKVSAGVTLADASVLDLAGAGRGVVEHLLGRVPSSGAREPPPMLRLQYSDARSAAVQPTLDAVVQPLALRLAPGCLARLAGFVPPVLEGSFAASVLGAVNQLGPAARAAIKAEHVHALGPPLDILVKLLDFQVVIPEPEGAAAAAAPRIALHTGMVIAKSVKEPAFISARGVHSLLARMQTYAAGSIERDAAEAAISTVEQHLVYNKLDFTVSSLQVVAAAAPRPGEMPGGSPRRQLVLHPLQVQGRLQLHRISEDYGVPQVQVSVQLAPVQLALTPALVQQVAEALVPPAPSAPPPASSPVAVPLLPTPFGSGPSASPALVVVDLRVATVDVDYTIEGSGPALLANPALATPGAAAAGGGRGGERRVAAHAHLSIASLAANVQVLLAGLHARASLAGLVLRDLSPEGEVPPPVRGLLPHLGKSLSVDALDVTLSSGVASGGGLGRPPPGTVTQVRIELDDIAAQGYPNELGNFIARFNDRRPTQCVVTVEDSAAATHTSVTLSNLAVGHAILLRIAALLTLPGALPSMGGSDSPAQQSEGEPDPLAAEAAEPSHASLLADGLGAQPAAEASYSPEQQEHQEQDQQQRQQQQPGEASPPPAGDAQAEGNSPRAGPYEGGDHSAAHGAASPRAAALPHATGAAEVAASAAATPPRTPAPPSPHHPQPPAPPGKPATTEISVQDSRLQWKYQPEVAPVRGSLAAVHDALSLHEDLLSLEVLQLRLRLPLKPPAPPPPASMGWRSATPSPSKGGAAAGADGAPEPLVVAAGVKLSAAVVGFGPHSMLPLLVLPRLQLATSVAGGGGGGASRPTTPTGRGAAAAPVPRGPLVHHLSVEELELGAHPSHMNMIAAAFQLAQDEFELLSREPAEHAPDSASVVTSASGHGAGAPAAAPASGGGSRAASAPALLEIGGGGGGGAVAVAPAAAPAWRLEAAAGLVGVSLLGSTVSSTCLKLEWRGIQCSYAPLGAEGGGDEEGGHRVRLAWRHVSLHLLQPRPAFPSADFTPFGAPPPMSTHPSAQALGAAAAAPPLLAEPLFLWQQGMAASFGARRNLSAGLGLADAPDAAEEDDGFVDPLPLPSFLRASGSSAASRYFSAAESEFEDAASDWVEGAHSPHGRGAGSPVLPLQIDSPSHEPLLLAMLHGCVAPAAAGEREPSDAPEQQQLAHVGVTLNAEVRDVAVAVGALAARLHVHGWEDAALCLRTYQVLAEQAWRQLDGLPGARPGPAALPGAPTAGALPGASPRLAGGSTPGAAAGGHTHEAARYRFALEALVVEVLGVDPVRKAAAAATPGGGGGAAAALPLCSLCTRASAEVARGEEGETRVSLAVPALLVAAGSVPAGAVVETEAVQLPLHDSLLGMRGLELTLLSGRSAAAEQAHYQQAAEKAHQHPAPAPAAHEVQQTSVGISVAQLSGWAAPHSLVAMTVLARQGAAQAAALAAHAGGDALEAARTAAARPGGAPAHQLTLKINLHQLGLLLSVAHEGGGHGGQTSPLFELAASRLSADVRAMGGGSLEGTLKTRLLLNCLNGHKLAWEPVLEPWGCRFTFAVPTAAGGRGVGPGASRLRISSKQGMELSVTEAVVDAAALAVGALYQVGAATEAPGDWEWRAEGGVEGAAAAFGPSFWLNNQTGSALAVWLVHVAEASAAAVPPPAGPPDLVAAPGRRVALPAPPDAGGQRGSLYAGQPSAEEGVAVGSTAEAGAAQGGGPSQLQPRALLEQPEQAPHFRTLLYFQLREQGELCGPLHLDSVAFTMLTVPVVPDLRAKVVAGLQEGRCGSCLLHLHSGVRLHNRTQQALDVGMQTPMGLVMEPQTLGSLRPGEAMWLPVLRAESGHLCVRPAAPAGERGLAGGAAASAQPQRPPLSPLVYATGQLSPQRTSLEAEEAGGGSGGHGRACDWSPAVPLAQLIGSGHGERTRPYRQVACPAPYSDAPLLLCIGAAAAPPASGAGWDVLVAPPLTLHNALPVPAEVTLFAKRAQHRVSLLPNRRAAVHALDAAHVESLTLRPLGYRPSAPIHPVPIAPPADTDLLDGRRSAISTLYEEGREVHAPDTVVLLQQLGHSRPGVRAFVRHALDTGTGAHTLRFGCTMWVYNCTGVPIALRQSMDYGSLFAEPEVAKEDDVPDSWLPPLQLPGQLANGPAAPASACVAAGPAGSVAGGSLPPPAPPLLRAGLSPHCESSAGLRAVSLDAGVRPAASLGPPAHALSAPHSTGGSVVAPSRGASVMDMLGLCEILDCGSVGSGAGGSGATGATGDGRSVLGMKRTVSRARGIADSMESVPVFETPSSWPSMQGGLRLHKQCLRLQVRATQCKAPFGRTYWSDGVELDALGGAAVVAVPAPLLPPTAAVPAPRAAIVLSVTASQVPGGEGSLALYLLPRYVLHNTLDVAIQYKQQGTGLERELEAGGALPLRWADGARPRRLCVRVQEAGWLWSGGFELETPGDVFVKIRHRDRGVTMLVRADVATSEAGVLRATLSHHPAGFAPYRVENCSLETLHARQARVREALDVLRPYCSLNYAWDEPAQPHRLELELPGNRKLGTFDLDQARRRGGREGRGARGGAAGCSKARLRSRSLGPGARADGAPALGGAPGLPRPRVQLAAWPLPAFPCHCTLVNSPCAGAPAAQVGQDVVTEVPRPRGSDERQRHVRVLVRAEGPTRVLTVVDVERHILPSELGALQPAGAAAPPRAVAASLLGANAAGAAAGAAAAAAASAAAAAAALAAGNTRRLISMDWALAPRGGLTGAGSPLGERGGWLGPTPPGLLWEVSAGLASVGLSLVGATQELSYLRAGELEASVAASAARYTLGLELRTLQVDNPSPWASLPVMLMLPAPTSRLASSVAGAVDLARRPAVRARLAVWQRRPAGVLCVEHAELELSPMAVFVEQQHATELGEFLARLAADFSGRSGRGSSGAPSAGGASAAELLACEPGGAAAGARAPSRGADSSAASEAGSTSAATGAPSALHADLEALLGGGQGLGLLPQHDQKIYTDLLRIGTLDITLSFVPAPFDPEAGHPRLLALQRLLSLADVEDARIALAGLSLRNALMGERALAQHLQRHYMRALLPEMYKLVGAASVLGDPVRLFHHLGLGVWSFLANPAAGLVESARQRGPAQFFWGLASGTQGLFQNVVFAFSNAASKGSAAARKAITVLGLEGYDSSWARATSLHRRVHWREDLAARGAGGPGDGGLLALPPPRRRPPGGAGGGLLGAVLHGAVGLVSEPVRGMDEEGLRGLVQGLARGALGFVVLPLASLLEMSARMAQSIRRAVAGASGVGWVRPPRFVSPGEPLAPYNFSEAMGRWLLTELERAAVAHAPPEDGPHFGAFVLCTPGAAAGAYLVLTTRHVLLLHARQPMWVPMPQWSSSIRDLQVVSLQGAALRLIAHRPVHRHVLRGGAAAGDPLPSGGRGGGGGRASSSPFTSVDVTCASEGGAEQARGALLALMSSTPPLFTFIGSAQMYMPADG
eukprot:scaffold2.g7395.t1